MSCDEMEDFVEASYGFYMTLWSMYTRYTIYPLMRETQSDSMTAVELRGCVDMPTCPVAAACAAGAKGASGQNDTTCIWYAEAWELKLFFYPSNGGFYLFLNRYMISKMYSYGEEKCGNCMTWRLHYQSREYHTWYNIPGNTILRSIISYDRSCVGRIPSIPCSFFQNASFSPFCFMLSKISPSYACNASQKSRVLATSVPITVAYPSQDHPVTSPLIWSYLLLRSYPSFKTVSTLIRDKTKTVLNRGEMLCTRLLLLRSTICTGVIFAI